MKNLPGPGDRRRFFRDSLNGWFDKLVENTQEKLVRDRWLRPPGALPEVAFLAACTRCGACTAACPPKAIRAVSHSGGLAAGTPFLNLDLEPCIGCPDTPCITACPTGALLPLEHGWKDFRFGAVEFFPDRCLTFDERECRLCVNACPVGEAALAQDEQGHPVLKREGCIGCGVCVRECITVPSSFQFIRSEG